MFAVGNRPEASGLNSDMKQVVSWKYTNELTTASYHITSVVAEQNINNAPPFVLAAVELNPETNRNALNTSAIFFCIFNHLVCTCAYMSMGQNKREVQRNCFDSLVAAVWLIVC